MRDIEWPPRSLDLTPCNYFLLVHLKNKVYATPPINTEDMRIRVTAEVNILKENPNLMKTSNEGHEKRSKGLRK